jgi:hypothetical protein
MNKWKYINRCLVCGTKLVFLRSTREGAKLDEGSKTCSHNHRPFKVVGTYDDHGDWHISYILPRN